MYSCAVVWNSFSILYIFLDWKPHGCKWGGCLCVLMDVLLIEHKGSCEDNVLYAAVVHKYLGYMLSTVCKHLRETISFNT